MPVLHSTREADPWAYGCTIRQLLCDDPACLTCELVACESSRYTDATGRPGSCGPVKLKLGLPRRKGRQKFPLSASVPAPTAVPSDLSPVGPICGSSSLAAPGIRKRRSVPFEESSALHWDGLGHSSSHQVEIEAFASSSSVSAASFTWTKSSSGLSEISVSSLTFNRSTCQLQVALTHSSRSESKASSESRIPQKRPRSHTLLRKTASHSPTGTSKDWPTEFMTANVPFLEEAVIASLESHVLVKKVQHYLGLPLTLLRSLRSFMLPAPDSVPQRRRREVGVATRPQALPFVRSATRKKLEVHLKRMVQLKRWQIPQKIQGALGQMKLPSQPRGKKPPSKVRKRGLAEAGVLGPKPSLASQEELQSHLVKKSLEISLEVFPAIVGHSQKLSLRPQATRLPKSILLGQTCPQLRNRLCLALRSKADVVDMNVKCKYLHFLWGLPTLYLQSLSMMGPRVPAWPTAPARVRATSESVSVAPPLVETWALEYHILRKRLQHQWGLPSLVLQSVNQFLVPLPPSPARAASVLCSRLNMKISFGDNRFLLTHLEIKERLETHLKTKIIERQWGLPRRALHSLQVFIPVAPPLVKRPKVYQKTYALAKRKPSTDGPSAWQKKMASSGKALQRHLTKKALEVQLGTIAPVARRSQAAAHQVQKKQMLPKVIPPRWKPPVPRPQELPFVLPSVLGNLQLNIIHKGLMHRWGLVTVYKKSLGQLFQGAGPPLAIAPSPSREPQFTAMQTPFLSQQTREVLEWHVRRKGLQHTWGVPGLVQRSLRYLLSAPSSRPRKGRSTEVAVSLTEPIFLNPTVRQALERNLQKRILSQQWQLPKRVLNSLHLLQPAWKVDVLSQNPPGSPLAQSRGRQLRKAGRPYRSAPPMGGALCPECYIKTMRGGAPQRSQGFPILGSRSMEMIEHHWMKKCMEVHLEVFPGVIKRSWKWISSASSQRLPKLVPPGQKPPQPRKRSLALMSQEDADRMEVTVRLSHLMSLWGLGVLYAEGLHGMIPPAPGQPRGRQQRAAIEFSGGRVSFLDGQAQEALELHVRKKWIQHEWGLPVLAHCSVKAFMQGSPLAPAFRKTTLHVRALPRDPAFLPQGARSRLEHHLQRMKLQREWGLPLRVLQSLRLLMPETEWQPADRTMELARKGFPSASSSRLHRRPRAEGAVPWERSKEAALKAQNPAACPACQGSALPRGAVGRLRQHLARKSMEVHLEVFPAIPSLSWRRASLSSKLPLPRMIPPGHRVLEPRHCSFPFLRTEELDRIELALRCSRLASLWGLGIRYVETLAGLVPRMPFHLVLSRRPTFGHPAGKPLFFPGLDTAALETHMKMKRLQHEWGLPGLALRSVGVFMQGAPALPRLSRTVIKTSVVPEGLSFLPRATCSLLEFHVQRMKLQRTWGLPARILASLRAFVPSASLSSFTLHYKEERTEQVESGLEETPRSLLVGKTTPCLSSEQKGMEDHLSRKYLETRLEVLPALVSQSKAAASGWEKKPLPKLVQSGQKHPKSRVASVSFLLPDIVDLFEVNVKHKHLALLWGLQSQYMEPLSVFALRGHPPGQVNREKIGFQEAKTPFFQEEARERLERHIQKKWFHHHWGLPSTVQRSLRAWAPALPTYAHPRQKTCQGVGVLVADITFVSVRAQKELEASLKKMIVLGRWGLPKRLQGYLHAFAHFPLIDRELRKEEVAKGGTSRPRQGKSVDLVSQQPPLQTPISPILGLFRSSEIRALENHLKKKSLEVKFRLPMVGVGSIQRAHLPKCSHRFPVVKPRGAVFFVKPETLSKVELNIKRKYLTHLWGIPSLHTESMKKMFGTIPVWPQKTVVGKEAARKGRGGPHPRKRTGNSAGFESRPFQPATAGPSFLKNEALDLLESHIRHKKLQHEWGLPSTIQKSLRGFAPVPSDVQRSTPSLARPAMRPSCVQVSIILQSIPFLDPVQIKHLEEHLKSRTAAHRWGIPKKVQQSLKMFLPAASLSPRIKGTAPTLLGHFDQVPLGAAQYPWSKSEGLPGGATSGGFSPSIGLEGQAPPLHPRSGEQPAELALEEMHQDKTRKTPGQKSLQEAKFLTSQARDLLEFHLHLKRIQHEWGLPSIALKSLRAFLPLPPDSRASLKPRAGAYLAAKGLGVETTAAGHTPQSMAEVSVPFQAMLFLEPDVKSRLEAHVRSRVVSHRWGLPKLVQDSLRGFLPPGLQPQGQPSQSHQQRETHPDLEGKESLGARTPKKQKRVRLGKPGATTSPGKKVPAFMSPQLKLSFLPEEELSLLEFHMQRKKVQHLWGLPSTVLKSLHAFAPFPFETQKDTQHPGKIIPEKCPWVRGEVRVVPPSLAFLSPDTKQRLEAQLSNIVAKHRWGLPALVQRSLKGFLPPTYSSPSMAAQAWPRSAQPHVSSQGAATGDGHHSDSKQKVMPGRRKTGNRDNVHQKKRATAFSSPEGKLPFLTGEAQELLEFHMQRKKVQHLWGLPSTVLKSLRTFAPFPAKQVQRVAGSFTERRPWDVEVSPPVQSLSFLDADTREHLEAHIRSRTVEHRWALPKLIQESLRALLPSGSLLQSGETSRQPRMHQRSESPHVPEIQPQMGTERSAPKLPSRKETTKEMEEEKLVATSFTTSAVPPATSRKAKLPFLTDSNQDALEFHIQHKKIQHEWGIPLTVQKSVHAFAPVPPEPSTGARRAAVAGAKDIAGEMGVGSKKPWVTGLVNVSVSSLPFLSPDIKENLEGHLRSLTAEHRWHLPRLVLESTKGFMPLPSHLDSVRGREDQEFPSAYSHGKTRAPDAQSLTEATEEASSEDERAGDSEPLHETERGGGTDSGSATEEPLFCPDTEPEPAMVVPGRSGSWKVEKGSFQRNTLEERPSVKMAAPRQGSMGFDLRRDPRVSSLLSSSSPGPKKYRPSARSWSPNLPRARYSSGRPPTPRFSEATLQNRKGMLKEVEWGVQRTAEGSHSEVGLKEPQATCIPHPGWELGSFQKRRGYPCVCYLTAHRDDSGSSLLSDVEQGWGKAKGAEPDSLGSPELQDAILSSEESPTSETQQEQEPSPSAGIMPESAGAAPQGSISISEEDENRIRETWERKKGQPHLPRYQPSVRELRRWSSKDLCKACRGRKPFVIPKESEEPASEAVLSNRHSGVFHQHHPPAPRDQGLVERNGGFQGHPEYSLQATTGDSVKDRKAEGGSVSSSKEPQPLSREVVSQFSQESESERVGDGGTEEEEARQRNHIRKEEAESTGEMPRMEARLEATASAKRAGSPAAPRPHPSSKRTVLPTDGPAVLKTEKRRVFGPDSEGRRVVVRMQTVRVLGPEGPREEEEGVMHWRKEPSPKGSLPGKEVLGRDGSSHPIRSPGGPRHLAEEALKMAREVSKGIGEEGPQARFVRSVHAKDMHRKLSLLGTIVERKLFLQQGYRVWVQSREREKGSQRGSKKISRAPRPSTFQATTAARIRWMEVQCCDSRGAVEPRGADRPLLMGPQRQASKMGSPAPAGGSRRVCRRSRMEVTWGRSKSRERRKSAKTVQSGSRERE